MGCTTFHASCRPSCGTQTSPFCVEAAGRGTGNVAAKGHGKSFHIQQCNTVQQHRVVEPCTYNMQARTKGLGVEGDPKPQP
jgi:hypothetical protein